jgi:dTDP-4-amino-4,6-dideoxygalactose transaminase
MRTENRISWWRTKIGDAELAKIKQSIQGENISQGPVTFEFEKRISEILGVPYVVSCTSGSTALLMASISLGIGSGDEVIVPNRTWIATAHAVLMAGAKVVLADDDGLRPEVFVQSVKEKINSRTKAIVPVHLGGRGADMLGLKKIAWKKNILIFEDAAQAFCSKNENGFLGTQSEAGCFSLSVPKLITTGQGGFVVTRNRKTYQKLQSLRNHGVMDPVMVKYKRMGFNFRFNDILASIGCCQLDRLNEKAANVKKIYNLYKQKLPRTSSLSFLEVNLSIGEIPLYAEIFAKKRTRLIKYLQTQKIQTRPYYPNLNEAHHLRDSAKFPAAAQFGRHGLFLPCGPDQPIENVNKTIAAIKNFLDL